MSKLLKCVKEPDLFHMQYLIQEKKSNYFIKYLRPQNLEHFEHHKRSSDSYKNADRGPNRPNSTIPRPAFPHSQGQSGPEICGAPLTH